MRLPCIDQRSPVSYGFGPPPGVVILALPNFWKSCTIGLDFNNPLLKNMSFARAYFFFYFSYSSPTAVKSGKRS
jgi:hypothetical protein